MQAANFLGCRILPRMNRFLDCAIDNPVVENPKLSETPLGGREAAPKVYFVESGPPIIHPTCARPCFERPGFEQRLRRSKPGLSKQGPAQVR